MKTYRSNHLEIRSITKDKDIMRVVGLGVVFNTPTVLYSQDGVDYSETIEDTSLNTTPLNDVLLRYNHSDASVPLARTRGGSLKLEITKQGLVFDATFFNTYQSRDIFTLVEAGALDSCSFGFSVKRDGSSYNRATHLRTITKFDRIYEISLVDMPAYNDAIVEARSYFQAQSDMENLETNKELRRKLLLRTYFDMKS